MLKEKIPSIKIIGVEPAASPLLSKGQAGPHKIQGIGANFVPKILNRDVIDSIEVVENEAAIKMAKNNPNKKVLTMLNDTAERYLSTDLFNTL